MKGRPPGTPKSDDPSKKKRKRTARERDLCDVKIKITEYSAGAQIQLEPSADGISESTAPQSYHPLEVGPGQRFWTIQRVNGNGGNGKGDGVAGPHKHTLARSDEIKKNSVQRFLANQDKETKKTQVSSVLNQWRSARGGGYLLTGNVAENLTAKSNRSCASHD
jgi:glutathione S-transferase